MKYSARGAVLLRHCIAEFIKQVFPEEVQRNRSIQYIPRFCNPHRPGVYLAAGKIGSPDAGELSSLLEELLSCLLPEGRFITPDKNPRNLALVLVPTVVGQLPSANIDSNTSFC